MTVTQELNILLYLELLYLFAKKTSIGACKFSVKCEIITHRRPTGNSLLDAEDYLLILRDKKI